MIKEEIVEKISKYFKLTNYEAEKIYDDIFSGIIQGVKEDNIADVTNLGEFIIKYNSGDTSQKKTVEFLPTLSLEEEVNQRSFEEQRTFQPAPFTSQQSESNLNVPKAEEKAEFSSIESKNDDLKTVETFTEKTIETVSSGTESHSVEDEIKKKREEILSKITNPKHEYIHEVHVTEQKITEVPLFAPFVIPQESSSIKEPVKEVFESTKENLTESIQSNITNTEKEVEEIKEKSFSDFFSEVKQEAKQEVKQDLKQEMKLGEKFAGDFGNKTFIPPIENVIPPTAVELHNQITGDQNKNINYQPTPMPLAGGNGNGNGNGNGDLSEHRLSDNSYYIWYKDSEPNTADTQTMSYEYELLYQATKEAEYKSKLRIYVTTFIMFFSVVLLLLIFSPVIYKYFFSPKESDQNTEEVQEETGVNTPEDNTPSTDNQASVNKLEDNKQNNTPPTTTTTESQNNNSQPIQQEQPKQEPSKQEVTKQEQPKQEPVQQKTETAPPPQQNNSPKVTGVTKNAMGWMDDVNKVIYVQLENGKFTIQESAWDSDSKANKRISAVGAIIPGLKGNVVMVDLGTKGTWYRARFGEFSTIEEAKTKAEELRTKERIRLQALLLSVFLYA
ncbi:MAG: SPOR domain-containing protein [Ignavibacteria bacterium]|nr:SPOR domain-containing protein [Ignavibacteria bacterium]